MDYWWRLEISASKLLQKIQICYKYLDKHVKIFFTIIFWVTKIKFLWKLAKNRGLWKIFGPILGFYTKNSPRHSWSSHFMITFWNQKSRNVRTPCTRHFHFELNHRSVTKLKLFLFYVSVITCYLWVVFLLKIQWEISLQGLQGLQ